MGGRCPLFPDGCRPCSFCVNPAAGPPGGDGRRSTRLAEVGGLVHETPHALGDGRDAVSPGESRPAACTSPGLPPVAADQKVRESLLGGGAAGADTAADGAELMHLEVGQQPAGAPPRGTRRAARGRTRSRPCAPDRLPPLRPQLRNGSCGARGCLYDVDRRLRGPGGRGRPADSAVPLGRRPAGPRAKHRHAHRPS